MTSLREMQRHLEGSSVQCWIKAAGSETALVQAGLLPRNIKVAGYFSRLGLQGLSLRSLSPVLKFALEAFRDAAADGEVVRERHGRGRSPHK